MYSCRSQGTRKKANYSLTVLALNFEVPRCSESLKTGSHGVRQIKTQRKGNTEVSAKSHWHLVGNGWHRTKC